MRSPVPAPCLLNCTVILSRDSAAISFQYQLTARNVPSESDGPPIYRCLPAQLFTTWIAERFFGNGKILIKPLCVRCCGRMDVSSNCGPGARSQKPRYRHFFITPVPGGGVTSARLEHQSVRGPISIQWTLESGVFSLAISVPPGSEATVTIPASSPHSVTESGKPIAEVDHCRVLASSVGCTRVKVKSGTYAFIADYSITVGSAVPPPEAGSSAQA